MEIGKSEEFYAAEVIRLLDSGQVDRFQLGEIIDKWFRTHHCSFRGLPEKITSLTGREPGKEQWQTCRNARCRIYGWPTSQHPRSYRAARTGGTS